MTAPAKFLQGACWGQQVIAGQVTFDSNARATAEGDGWSIARTDDNDGNGLIAITIDNDGKPLVAAFAVISDSQEAAINFVQFVSFAASTGVLTFRTVTDDADGTLTVEDPAAAFVLNFMAILG